MGFYTSIKVDKDELDYINYDKIQEKYRKIVFTLNLSVNNRIYSGTVQSVSIDGYGKGKITAYIENDDSGVICSKEVPVVIGEVQAFIPIFEMSSFVDGCECIKGKLCFLGV